MHHGELCIVRPNERIVSGTSFVTTNRSFELRSSLKNIISVMAGHSIAVDEADWCFNNLTQAQCTLSAMVVVPLWLILSFLLFYYPVCNSYIKIVMKNLYFDIEKS